MGFATRNELDAQAAKDKADRERKANMTRKEKKDAMADRMKVLDKEDAEQALLFPDDADVTSSGPPSPTLTV